MKTFKVDIKYKTKNLKGGISNDDVKAKSALDAFNDTLKEIKQIIEAPVLLEIHIEEVK